jgi:hypoxanthine phosphoribosyltransferase
MRLLLSSDDIADRVRALGAAIARDYAGSRDLVLVGVMRGSVCFLADLMRAIDRPLRIDLCGVRSYSGTEGGDPELLSHLLGDVRGADVIVVEDIIERGMTLRAATELISQQRPASLEVCALLRKDVPREWEPKARYVGFEIGPEFVVGYGLDYEQRFRNLPYIGVPEPGELER